MLKVPKKRPVQEIASPQLASDGPQDAASIIAPSMKKMKFTPKVQEIQPQEEDESPEELSQDETAAPASSSAGDREPSEQGEEAQEQPPADKSFADLGVTPEIVKACTKLGWKKPSEIQSQVLPYALKGRDIIGLAETGSGKTGVKILCLLDSHFHSTFLCLSLLTKLTSDLQAFVFIGAFAIPILQALLADPHGLFALVLAPTRELAFQVSEQFEALGSVIG